MNRITQDMQFRKSLLKYAERYGVEKAARKYKTNRQYVYRWKWRYDGTWESLKDKSHRPHHHPNQHTEAELKLISNMRRRNPNAGLVVFWVKLCQRGYTRSIPALYRVLVKRREMGFTQQKVAFCIGIEPRTIQYAEYGRLPDTPVFLKLCSFYDLTAGDYGDKMSPV